MINSKSLESLKALIKSQQSLSVPDDIKVDNLSSWVFEVDNIDSILFKSVNLEKVFMDKVLVCELYQTTKPNTLDIIQTWWNKKDKRKGVFKYLDEDQNTTSQIIFEDLQITQFWLGKSDNSAANKAAVITIKLKTTNQPIVKAG